MPATLRVRPTASGYGSTTTTMTLSAPAAGGSAASGAVSLLPARDTYEGPRPAAAAGAAAAAAPRPAPPAAPPAAAKPVEFGWGYRVGQWSSNVLVVGGAATVVVLLFLPEPILTKLIAAGIAGTAVALGVVAKHLLYKNAYMFKALHEAIAELRGQVADLRKAIDGLEKIRGGLQQEVTRLQQQIDKLEKTVKHLDEEVAAGFKQLNKDRKKLEVDRARVADEWAEADATGNANTKQAAKLLQEESRLEGRDRVLDTREAQLTADREELSRQKTEFAELQQKLLRRLAAPGAGR